METNKYLAIYLKDHHAASTAGVDLAKRALGSNIETSFEAGLKRICQEIAQDKKTLEDIMRRLEVHPDHVKVALAWGAEKVGRLKLNGQITGYSPLSRVVELEGLLSGITAKKQLWRSLKLTPGASPTVAESALDGLIDRANHQMEIVADLRDEASLLAFSDDS